MQYLFCFDSFYKGNHVQRFQYSKPFTKGQKNKENEFAVKIKFLIQLMKIIFIIVMFVYRACGWNVTTLKLPTNYQESYVGSKS